MSNINKATVVSSTSLFASSISGFDNNQIGLDKYSIESVSKGSRSLGIFQIGNTS